MARSQNVRRHTRNPQTSRRSASSRRRNPFRSMARLRAKSRRKTGTKTKTKSKLNQKVTHDQGPLTDSWFKYRSLPGAFSLGKFKKLGAPQYYVSNQIMRLDVPIGKQGVLGIDSAGNRVSTGSPAIYNASDITNMFIQAKSMVDTPANVLNPKTQKIYMDGCKFELLMTNQTNDVIHVQLYCVTARRDLTTTDASENSYATPPDAWVKGNIDEGNINAWNIVGSSPFQAPGFTENYKVEKIIDVNLHSGGHHKHVVRFNPRKMFSNELTTEIATGVFRGWTKHVFAVVHGYALNDSTTKTQVSTAQCSIDFIWRKEYEYHICERSTTQLYTVNALPTAFTVGGEIQTDAYTTVTPITTA